jgi:hypothetical protein
MLAMQREYRADMARQEFDHALEHLGKALPEVIAKNKDGGYGDNQYKYATLGTILTDVKPVLSQHGFTTRWRTEMEGQVIRVTCELRHRSGHIEENWLSGPPDSRGGKTQMQAIGSTVSYLSRYTLIASLGITTGDMPDADERQKPSPTTVDELRNLRALAKLRREYGIDVEEAEEYLGRVSDWTAADIARIPAWLESRKEEGKS